MLFRSKRILKNSILTFAIFPLEHFLMKIDIKINSKNIQMGQLIILVSSFMAFISLFLPWVNAAFVTASAFQMHTFLFILFYILPVYQVFNRKKFFLDPTHNFMVEIGSGVFASFCTLIFIFTRSTNLFGHSVNLSGSGSYLFLVCSLALTYGSYLDYQKNK